MCDHLYSEEEEEEKRFILKGWCCIVKDCEYKQWRCSECLTDYLVRKKLEQKTANHHFY